MSKKRNARQCLWIIPAVVRFRYGETGGTVIEKSTGVGRQLGKVEQKPAKVGLYGVGDLRGDGPLFAETRQRSPALLLYKITNGL